MMNQTTNAFDFVPLFTDSYQSSACTHVGYTVDASGKLFAHFADGGIYPSVYKSVAELLEAGKRDYRERVRKGGK